MYRTLFPIIFNRKCFQNVGVSVQSNASTITFPWACQKGDLAILADLARNTVGIPSSVTPSGFTNCADNGANSLRLMTSVKILTGAEPNTALTGMNGTSANRKVMGILRPTWNIKTVSSPVAWPNDGTAGDPNPQTIAIVGRTEDPIIVISSCGASTSGGVLTSAPPFAAQYVDATGDVRFGWEQYNAGEPRVNHVTDMNDAGSNAFHSGFIVFT